jgi:hypothetical protein
MNGNPNFFFVGVVQLLEAAVFFGRAAVEPRPGLLGRGRGCQLAGDRRAPGEVGVVSDKPQFFAFIERRRHARHRRRKTSRRILRRQPAPKNALRDFRKMLIDPAEFFEKRSLIHVARRRIETLFPRVLRHIGSRRPLPARGARGILPG